MRKINKSALVAYSAAQMYALVDDVDRYQEFLPWCSQSSVLQRSDNEVTATLVIAYGKLNKSFTSRNSNTLNERIHMQVIDGPFKHLRGDWRFASVGDGCRVTLDMEFEFSSKLLDLSVGPVFNKIADSLVDAFITRATKIYGG